MARLCVAVSWSADELGYMMGGYYRVVGGVQIRQQRVGNDSCVERRFISTCEVETYPNGTKTACLPR